MVELFIGVNVLVVGISIGIIINFDGIFILEVLEDVIELLILYIGYEFQVIFIIGQLDIRVSLLVGIILGEVVVMGYVI